MTTGFYFHGTVADLHPGDTLKTGDEVGVTVHCRSKHVYMTYASDEEGREQAIREAVMWAAFAADELGCTQGDECPSIEDESFSWHSDGDSLGYLTPDCVTILEVKPIGKIEEDTSEEERGETFYRAKSALIVDTVSRDEVWQSLMS